jgi:hypothetical protein
MTTPYTTPPGIFLLLVTFVNVLGKWELSKIELFMRWWHGIVVIVSTPQNRRSRV